MRGCIVNVQGPNGGAIQVGPGGGVVLADGAPNAGNFGPSPWGVAPGPWGFEAGPGEIKEMGSRVGP